MNQETRAAWKLPFTVADEVIIEGLDNETRDAVERYCRQATFPESASDRRRGLAENAINEIGDALQDLRGLAENAINEIDDARQDLRRAESLEGGPTETGSLNWSAGDANPGTFQSPNTNRSARNHHPTVKPLALMRWLVRLVTPPGGRLLDPFAGSGTTLVAAVEEGVAAVGLELSEEFAAIARARINAAHPTLFGGA